MFDYNLSICRMCCVWVGVWFLMNVCKRQLQICGYGFFHFISPLLSRFILFSRADRDTRREALTPMLGGSEGDTSSPCVSVYVYVCEFLVVLLRASVLSVAIPTFNNFPEFPLPAINSVQLLCGPCMSSTASLSTFLSLSTRVCAM